MSRYITLFLLSLVSFAATAQDKSSGGLSVLHKELNGKANNDTAYVNSLLKIGRWHLKAAARKAFPKSKDSIEFYADKAYTLSKKANYRIGEGKYYLFYAERAAALRNTEETQKQAEKALAIFGQINYREGIADADFLIYGAYKGKSDEDLVKKVLRVRDIYKEVGNREKEATAVRLVSSIYMDAGNIEKSMQYGKEAIALLEEYPPSEVKVKNLLNLVILNHYTGKMDESLHYSVQAADMAEKLDPSADYTGYCFSQLGILYYYLKRSEEALPYLIKSYTISLNYNDKQIPAVAVGNIIMVLLDLKRYNEALTYLKQLEKMDGLDLEARISTIARSITVYNSLKQFDNSKKYVAKAEQLLKEYPEGMILARLYTPVAVYYFYTKQYDLSRKYFEMQLNWAEKSKNKTTLSFVHQQLYKIDSIQKAFGSAVKHLTLSQKYNDSVFNEQSQDRINELNVKYDVAKKERDLELQGKNNKLLQKQNELQKEKLSRSNLVRNLSIAGTVVVILFLLLLYNRHKTNKRTNLLLEKQQAEILSSNKELQHMVTEKEWLLKEIHHRVKNNLHIIMSLLNSQSYFLQDEAALSAIQNSQHRIQSMSLIHQKLYMADNLAAIRMQDYINDLVEYLTDSFSNKKDIKFQIIVEDIEMDVSQAVPIGLILNEAITNSFKYAFPDKKGNINVFLTNTVGEYFCLEIIDNGVGLPEGFTIEKTQSLGMKLIKGLTEDLEGNLDIISGPDGTHLKIEFLYKQLLLERPIED